MKYQAECLEFVIDNDAKDANGHLENVLYKSNASQAKVGLRTILRDCLMIKLRPISFDVNDITSN